MPPSSATLGDNLAALQANANLKSQAVTTTAFCDDFNTFDIARWNRYTTPGYWGFYNTSGTYDAANTTVENGYLVLKLNYVSGDVASTTNPAVYKSAVVQSLDRMGYGTYETWVRAANTSNVPATNGTQVKGTLSLLNSYMEYDYTDAYTKPDTLIESKYGYGTANDLIFSTYKTNKPETTTQVTTPQNLSQGFHLQRMEWSPTTLKFYVDGALVHSVTDPNVIPSEAANVFFNIWPVNKADWNMPGSNATRYTLVDKFCFTPQAAPPTLPTEASATIGPVGGSVETQSAKIILEPNRVEQDATITLKQLATPPAPIPSYLTLLASLQVTSSQPIWDQFQLQIKNVNLAADERVEAYIYNEDTQEYEEVSLDGRSGDVTIPTGDFSAWRDYARSSEGVNSIQPTATPLRQMSDPVPVRNLKLMVVRFSEGVAIARGQQIGATFENGVFACPNGTRRYFFECANIALPNAPTLTKFLSINVGNASLYCNGQYNFKLCSKATLRRIRDNINVNLPDIITIQEVWNGTCQTLDSETDRFCSSNGQMDRDWEMRTLLGAGYDYRCTSITDGGYDCVALKRTKFLFEANSENVQNSYMNRGSIDCSSDGKLGADTGVFGFTVRQVGQLSPVPYNFDVWTVHTATPLAIGNATCRANQLDNLYKAIYRLGADARRHIVAGDFNSTYNYVTTLPPADVLKLRSMTLRHDADVKSIALRPLYMISNASDPTVGAVSKNPLFTFDHVLSNFTEDNTNCQRKKISQGLDHAITYCSLFGIDSGTKTITYEAFDTSSGNLGAFLIDSALTPSRKGAYLPYVSAAKISLKNTRIPDPIEAIAHRTVTPAGVTVYFQMKPKFCDYAPNIEILQTLNAGDALPLQKYRAAVFMDYCPAYKF